METGQRTEVVKMIDITKSHCTITAVAFSHQFRLYLVVTSKFHFIFLNELCYAVHIEMRNELSTVNFVHFNDKQEQLVTAGIKGLLIFNFRYQGKYNPKLAAQHDKQGKNINIYLFKKRLLDPTTLWIKGMKID